MKIKDIQVGPVYWFDKSNNWGTYIRPAFDRHPVVRVDDKRYKLVGHSWTAKTAREDPKGSYVATREVDVETDGTPISVITAKVEYRLATQIRGTYEAIKADYDRQHDAARQADAVRQVKADAASSEAAALTARLEALQIAGIRVGATTGSAAWSNDPEVTVLFDLGDKVATLVAILDRLERAETLAAAAQAWGMSTNHSSDAATVRDLHAAIDIYAGRQG